MKKRMLSILLVFCMIFSMMPVSAFAAEAEPHDHGADTPATQTIYLNGGYTTPHIYYWSDENPSMIGWPGVEMENDVDSIYFFDVPAEAEYVIFNNAVGSQTGDLTIPTDGRNIYDKVSNDWGSYLPCDHDFVSWVDNRDGTHNAVCSKCAGTRTGKCSFGDNGSCICGAVTSHYDAEISTWLVYDDSGLVEALAEGGNIRLMGDIEKSILEIKREVTLDLNGYTLRCDECSIYDGGVLSLIGDGDFRVNEVVDVKAEGQLFMQGGHIQGHLWISGGFTSISGGSVDKLSFASDANSGRVIISGGFVDWISNTPPSLSMLTINGGSFGYDTEWIRFSECINSCCKRDSYAGIWTIICSHETSDEEYMATCTEQAVCSCCGKRYGEYADHVGGEATCASGPICTVCGGEYGEADPNAHISFSYSCQDMVCLGCGIEMPATEEHVDEDGDDYCDNCWNHLKHVAPDEEIGQTCMGYWCTVCESWYGEADPNAHNYVGEVPEEATCETAGLKCYTCELCNSYYEESIPAYHDNNMEYHPEKDAIDCLTPGNIEYWYCPGCFECFSDAYAEGYINPWFVVITGECTRPEDAADCAVVPCEVCGEDTYGYGEHDVVACQGGTCSKCLDEIEGLGCVNYDTPACEDGLCYYCGGFVAGFGHENGAWGPCCDGECSYGCGLLYPATEEHVDEDGDDYCDNCWNHLKHVAPDEYDPCYGYDCEICWTWVEGQHTPDEEIGQTCMGYWCTVCESWYGEADPDAHNFVDGSCTACGDTPAAAPAAEITGLSITVDGVTYTEGNVIIKPDSTVYFTVFGEGLQYSNDGYTIDTPMVYLQCRDLTLNEDGTFHYPTEAGIFESGVNYEITYTNDGWQTIEHTGIFLTYDDGTTEVPAFEIVKQPVSVTGTIGETVSVSVEATGEGLTYQWYYRDAGKETFNKSIYTGDTYSLIMYIGRDGREIYCVVSDAYGNTVTTDIATLSIQPGNELVIESQPTSAGAAYNETAVSTVKASGDGLKYQWYYRNKGKEDFVRSTYTGDTYSLIMYEGRDGREIYCVISDAYGNTVTTDIATLSIQPRNELVIESQPASASAAYNETAVSTVKASGDGLKYQWYYRNKGKEDFVRSTYTGDTYSLIMYEGRDGREIYCVVSDAYGNQERTNTVILRISETPVEN